MGAGVGYVAGGLSEADFPSAPVGYLYLSAFAGLSTGALIGSPLRVKTSHRLDEDVQLWLFLAYLAIVLWVMIARRQRARTGRVKKAAGQLLSASRRSKKIQAAPLLVGTDPQGFSRSLIECSGRGQPLRRLKLTQRCSCF